MTGFMKLQFFQNSKVVFIAVLVVMATSCSIKTMYKQLDYFIPSYVEGMVSLDSILEKKVDQRTLALINWHRNTQLEKYATWLGVIQRDANQQLTEEKILQHFATLNGFWQSLSLKLNEEMVTLLPLLNSEQREELFSNIEDNNDEFREDSVAIDNDERIEKYIDRMIDIYESWLGNLTNEQENTVKLAATQMRVTSELRLKRRLQWQQSIKRILETSDSKTQKVASLEKYFISFNKKDNVALNTADKINKEIIARLTLQIVHSMTSEQNTHFVSKTNDYIRMFTELVQER